MSLNTQYQNIKQEIITTCEKAGRNNETIQLIAVTKYVTIEETEKVIKLGVTSLGENREQGFIDKKEAFKDETLEWHFIGPLQSRKVKNVINDIDYFHALDRIKIAKEIDKRAEHVIPCFVQLNISGEAAKGGIEPDELLPFLEALKPYPKVKVVGLMTMAPYTDDQDLIRPVFKKCRQLRDLVMEKQFSHAPCQFLSMGMSGDFKIAIEEGATHLRIGSLLVTNKEEG